MAVTLPGAIRTVFTWTRTDDDEIVQTLHQRGGAGITQSQLQSIAAGWHTAINVPANPLRERLRSDLTLARITCYDMSPGSQLAAEVPTSIPGEGGSSVHAHQVAAVITWLTALRGPRHRGRLYVGPLGGAPLDNTGRLSAGAMTGLSAAAGWIWQTALSLDAALVVASYTGQTMTDVNAARIDNSPDVQRRRQRKATSVALQPLVP